MNRLKSKLLIIMLALILPGMTLAASSSRGSSGGFKSGFSSQRSVSRPAAPPPTNSSFGKFDTSKPASYNKSDSALNRDLEKNQAQANALKSMDARNQKSNSSAGNTSNISNTSNTSSNATAPGNQSAANYGNATNTGSAGNYRQTAPVTPSVMPAAPIYQPAPVIVQQRGSGIGGAVTGGILGFMLGSAMSHSQAANHDSRSGQLDPFPTAGAANSANADGAVKSSATDSATAAPVEHEAVGWSLLRVSLWALLLGGMGWLGYKIWRFIKPVQPQEKQVHYSLGGN
ncbi:hypothetical protein [Undibacterium sp. TJN19]|uniref:hypothetical protein n=1 Tax=Undibacterium sp. TJN19 TaxID=3413055 RepID=UPI003BF146CF